MLLAVPAAAFAQPVSGLYVAGGVGANFRTPSKAIHSSIPVKVKADDVGLVAMLSMGWGFGNGVRAELEGNFRYNDVRRISLGGVTASRNQGYMRTYGGMANLFYDFNGLMPNITPYVGVGVGWGWSDWQKVRASGFGPGPQAQLRIADTAGAFAYQAIAGVSFSLASVMPGLSLTTEARYYATLEPALRASVLSTSGSGVTTTSFGKVKPANENISALIGFRYAFNTPAPTPAPVSAPMQPVVQAPGVARTYLVFFDWDRAELTSRAREIIKLAANNARAASVTRIEVAGHADRSGDATYNQRLSQQRGDAVAAGLMAEGVERGAISVAAFGESRPLVATADGVREPQNRRVEIVLR